MKKKATRTSDPKLQCSTIHCFNVKRRGRTICNTCRARQQRLLHPEATLFYNLKKSAKRRGLSFAISMDEWAAWCAKTGFLEMPRGRKKGSRSIGRIDHDKGYSIVNIRVEDYMFNASKQKGSGSDPDCPF